MTSNNITNKLNQTFSSSWNPNSNPLTNINDISFAKTMNSFSQKKQEKPTGVDIIYAVVGVDGLVELKSIKSKEKNGFLKDNDISSIITKVFIQKDLTPVPVLNKELIELQNLKYEVWTNKKASKPNPFTKRLLQTNNRVGSFIMFRRTMDVADDKSPWTYRSITNKEIVKLFRDSSAIDEVPKSQPRWLSKPTRSSRPRRLQKPQQVQRRSESKERNNILSRTNNNDKLSYTYDDKDDDNGINFISDPLEKEATETLLEIHSPVLEKKKRKERDESPLSPIPRRRRSSRKIKKRKQYNQEK